MVKKIKVKPNGGMPARIGKKFHAEVEIIREARKDLGIDDNLSTEKITDLIVRHQDNWERIKVDIINLSEEEIDRLWI